MNSSPRIVLDIGAYHLEGLQVALIGAGVGVRQAEGGQQAQPAPAAGEVPILPAAQVVQQGLVIPLHDDAHIAHAGVGHAGEGEVDEPVATAEGERGAGPLAHQLPQAGRGQIRINDAGQFRHFCTSSLV